MCTFACSLRYEFFETFCYVVLCCWPVGCLVAVVQVPGPQDQGQVQPHHSEEVVHVAHPQAAAVRRTLVPLHEEGRSWGQDCCGCWNSHWWPTHLQDPQDDSKLCSRLTPSDPHLISHVVVVSMICALMVMTFSYLSWIRSAPCVRPKEQGPASCKLAARWSLSTSWPCEPPQARTLSWSRAAARPAKRRSTLAQLLVFLAPTRSPTSARRDANSNALVVGALLAVTRSRRVGRSRAIEAIPPLDPVRRACNSVSNTTSRSAKNTCLATNKYLQIQFKQSQFFFFFRRE